MLDKNGGLELTNEARLSLPMSYNTPWSKELDVLVIVVSNTASNLKRIVHLAASKT